MRYTSPLDRAKGYEVAWQQVAEPFDAARSIQNVSFVYVVGEKDGPVKIGVAKDPIHRLRSLQTGNPRRLRVERVLIGTVETEAMLHEMWHKHAHPGVGREWFRAEVRPALFPIMETAANKQIDFLASTNGTIKLNALERLIREAHGEHDFVAHGHDEVRLLREQAGHALS